MMAFLVTVDLANLDRPHARFVVQGANMVQIMANVTAALQPRRQARDGDIIGPGSDAIEPEVLSIRIERIPT